MRSASLFLFVSFVFLRSVFLSSPGDFDVQYSRSIVPEALI